MSEHFSVASCLDYTLPLPELVTACSEVGIPSISLGGRLDHFDYRDKAKRVALKEMLDRHGVGVETIHAPQLDKEENLPVLQDAIIAANHFGCHVIVAHGSSFSFNRDAYRDNCSKAVKLVNKIIPFLENHNVKLAVENVMPGPPTKLVVEAVETVDNPFCGFCYDSAHDQIDGPRSYSLLEQMVPRLFAVHFSDRVKEFVDHVVPGDGFVNWTEIERIIERSDFSGPFVFEIMKNHCQTKDTSTLLKLINDKAVDIIGRIRRAHANVTIHGSCPICSF